MDSIPFKGCTVEWLLTFWRTYSDRPAPLCKGGAVLQPAKGEWKGVVARRARCDEVVRDIVLAETTEKKCSYLDLSLGSGQKPEKILCQFDGTLFHDVVLSAVHDALGLRGDALACFVDYDEYAGTLPADALKQSYWIYMFTVSLHDQLEDVIHMLGQATEQVEKGVVVALDADLQILEQARVLAVIGKALEVNKKITWSLQDLADKFCSKDNVNVHSCGVRGIRDCKASSPDEKETVLHRIDKTVGLQCFDDTVAAMVKPIIRTVSLDIVAKKSMDNTPAFTFKGCTVEWLLTFWRKYGERPAPLSKGGIVLQAAKGEWKGKISRRTLCDDVVRDVIVPETLEKRCSYMDLAVGCAQKPEKVVCQWEWSLFYEVVLSVVQDAIGLSGDALGRFLDYDEYVGPLPADALKQCYWIHIFSESLHDQNEDTVTKFSQVADQMEKGVVVVLDGELRALEQARVLTIVGKALEKNRKITWALQDLADRFCGKDYDLPLRGIRDCFANSQDEKIKVVQQIDRSVGLQSFDENVEKNVRPVMRKVEADIASRGREQEPAKAPTSPTAKSKAKKKEADGVASASQVVGGSWSPPKGPSPEDDVLVEDWKAKGKLHVLEGVWCAVPYKVTVVPAEDASGDTKAQAQEILDAVFKEVNCIFNHFIETSEVSAINRLDADVVHKPSPQMEQVLSMAATINQRTRGAFDPAILPLSTYFKENGSAPDADEAQSIAAYSKWSAFKMDADGIKKTQAKAKLDVCGLAKGWAIDELSKKLKAAGFSATFVDWGGDIKVTGKHPVGRNWTAAILRPPGTDAVGALPTVENYLAHIELRDGQSIATSGDYLQALAEGMSHIINPRAGEPCEISEEKCAQVSVVTSSCMLADALATAAMVNGKVAAARTMLDQFRGSQLKDPVGDYLLFTREGPRVVRMRVPAAENPEHATDRLGRHDVATVVVVGGGLAGVSAAIEAFKARAKVIIMEKEADLGGNSAKATSGINACATRVQYSQGVDDDGRYFERDTHVSAKGGNSDIACVTTLSEKSAEAIHWLIDELGIELQVLSQLGGHARKRTHRVPPRSDGTPVPVGYTIMQHARSVVEGIDDIQILKKCSMTRLLKAEDNEVSGVEYKDEKGNLKEIKADAVVMTTGGFGYDHSSGSLMQQWRPDLVGVPTTNGSFADGSGIRFGLDVGANLIDMDKVQLHPTAFIDPKDPGSHTKYLGPEALRGSGGILMDQQGRRFINELDLRSVVSNKILAHCDPYKMPDGTTYRPWSWCVLNDESQQKFGRPMLRFYKDQVGLFEAVEGTKGLAELIGCPESNVIDALKDYAKACDDKICQKTGKVVFPTRFCETDSNFIVARITPCIHYCMGGLEISSNAEVLRCMASNATVQEGASKVAAEASKGALGKRVKLRRLFAAGECTGGVHGGNRLGGNSLLECVVFGRLAGQRAATIKQSNDALLDSGDWVPVVLREVRPTDEKFGHNTAIYRFNLHGSMQHTGLEVGRFVSIRGELDGDTMTGYYSPISRPDDEGIIDILCRTDDKGGPIVNFLLSLKPGSSCLMKGMGGPRLIADPSSAAWTYSGNPGAKLRRFSLLAGGTGLAPALQIARAYFKHLQNHSEDDPTPEGGIKIVYAAESAGDLAFMQAFETLEKRFPDLIQHYCVLNRPPPGWTMGVGFVDPDCIRQKLWFPPSDDHLLVMCGPPIFEKIMCGNLSKLGYPREQYYSFDADPNSGT